MSQKLANLILEDKVHHSNLRAWLRTGLISEGEYKDATFLIIFKDANSKI